MSLRLRLIVIIVVLSGGVLVAVNVVTYTALHSFLLDRERTQLLDAVTGVDTQLKGSPVATATQIPTGAPGSRPLVPTSPAVAAGSRGSAPGTFGALLDGAGNSVRTLQLRDGDHIRPPPRLPDGLVAAAKRHAGPVEVDAVTGNGRYLIVARPQAGSPTRTVVAGVPLGAVDDTLSELRVIEGSATIIALLLIFALGTWSIRVGLRPLDRMGATASTIAAGDLTQRIEPVTERTEVGRLGLALNAMLAQIERAFSEQEASESRMRRFLADASHELRTPLTSIRGYAEAFRMGAADDPESLARAMRRIEHSAERMGVLVDDLLLLARLDAVRRVDGSPVDLAAIVDDACGDVRVTAADREITFTGTEGVVVLADIDQVHQIVDNLLGNAQSHTPAGTPIEVGVTARGDDGVLTVRDHGPGLPEGEAGRVFERFWRGDAARGDDGGAGLGLAIVQAIVSGHGGTATAENASGGGALFSIAIPLAPPATGG
jgi:two-component system, OmpR family, sensor kinase